MKTVATAARVSVMTVSLALRSHPKIPAATRERIREVARDLGYRPNPLVSALMGQLRTVRQRSGAVTTAIAYVVPTDLSRQEYFDVPVYQAMFRGASRRAEELGFKLVPFFFDIDGGEAAGRHVARVLRNRGIDGIVLSPLPNNYSTIGFDWEQFSIVSLGNNLAMPRLHRCCTDEHHSMTLALDRLFTAGYRKIGLVTNQLLETRFGYSHSSVYTGFLWRTRGMKKLPICLCETTPQVSATPGLIFSRWLKRHSPDAVVGVTQNIYEWLRYSGCRPPKDVGCVQLAWHPGRSNVSGVNQWPEELGAAGMSLVVQLLHHHETGVPRHPITMTIQGEWMQGETVRASNM